MIDIRSYSRDFSSDRSASGMILVDEGGGGGGGGGDGGGQKGKQQHHSGKFEFQTDEDAPLLSNGNNHQKPSPFVARLRYEGETRGGRKGGRKGQRERGR